MTKILYAATRLQAWTAATHYLIKEGRSLNLILDIESPSSDGTVARDATRLVDAFYRRENAMPLHSVAETIFPGWEYSRRGLRGVYETYPDQDYPALRTRWGTYAYRMLRRTSAAGEVVNPLRTLIEKMAREAKRAGGFKSCYELGVAEGEYDLPLYNTADDRNLTRGGPCLSHLSFKLFEGHVHLTALYRSHDYRYKVLGNMLGLARLQACVAKEVGVKMGNLVIHSTYAYLEDGRGLRKLLELVEQLGSLQESEEHRCNG